MTRPDYSTLDLPHESADPQDASQYGHDDQSGLWVGLITLCLAGCIGSIITLLCLWMAGAL